MGTEIHWNVKAKNFSTILTTIAVSKSHPGRPACKLRRAKFSSLFARTIWTHFIYYHSGKTSCRSNVLNISKRSYTCHSCFSFSSTTLWEKYSVVARNFFDAKGAAIRGSRMIGKRLRVPGLAENIFKRYVKITFFSIYRHTRLHLLCNQVDKRSRMIHKCLYSWHQYDNYPNLFYIPLYLKRQCSKPY